MTALTDNRKRSREDDNCDFMPLSKRINNLHINTHASMTASQVTEHQHIALRDTFRESNSVLSTDGSTPPYNPGITSTQSCYFFDNKLLYELYLERLQRNGQQSPY